MTILSRVKNLLGSTAAAAIKVYGGPAAVPYSQTAYGKAAKKGSPFRRYVAYRLSFMWIEQAGKLVRKWTHSFLHATKGWRSYDSVPTGFGGLTKRLKAKWMWYLVEYGRDGYGSLNDSGRNTFGYAPGRLVA